jgi:hypothetical protein
MRDLASIETTETKHGGSDSTHEGRIGECLPVSGSEVGSDEVDEQDGNHQRRGAARSHPSCAPDLPCNRSAIRRTHCAGDCSTDKSIRNLEVELVKLSFQ